MKYTYPKIVNEVAISSITTVFVQGFDSFYFL